MADNSTKPVQDLKTGDTILDGHLQPVKVLGLFKNLLGQRQLWQFIPDGPVFTEEHQFVMNLEEGQVGVYKKHALIRENPHLEAESDKILYLNDLDNLLQYKFGKITKVECLNLSPIFFAKSIVSFTFCHSLKTLF